MITPEPTTEQQQLQTNPLKESLIPIPVKGVLAKVNLGSPSKNCLGVGICSIDLLSSVKEGRNSLLPCSTIAILEKHKEDRLSIHFKIDSLSFKAIKAHFHEGTFIVEENYTLPNSIVQKIGCRPVIFSGFYPVKKSKAFFSVSF